jgi:hypothetical protein
MRADLRERLQFAAQDAWSDLPGSLCASEEPGSDLAIAQGSVPVRDGIDYYHLAFAVDDRAIKTLQERDFFKRYTEKTKFVAGGEVEVLPLEVVAETHRTTVRE